MPEQNRADGGFGGGFHALNLGESTCLCHPISGNFVVIASEAKQSIAPPEELMDCFVANAPRNDAYPLTGNVITS